MNDYQLDPVDVSVERYNMDTELVVVVDVHDEERRRSVTVVEGVMMNVTSAIVVEIVVHRVMTDDEGGVAY